MPVPTMPRLSREKARFHGICVNIAVRVVLRMVDGLVKVFLHLVQRPRVDCRFVGHNHFYAAPDVLVDNLPHGRRLRILSADQPQIPVAPGESR
jgi:hypothetical protein